LAQTGAQRTGPSVKNFHCSSPVSAAKAVTVPSFGEEMKSVLPATTGS